VSKEAAKRLGKSKAVVDYKELTGRRDGGAGPTHEGLTLAPLLT
jgi:hypothetical protein